MVYSIYMLFIISEVLFVIIDQLLSLSDIFALSALSLFIMEASLNQCKMDENRLATRVNLVERHVLSNSGDWHILGSKYIHFGIDKFFQF